MIVFRICFRYFTFLSSFILLQYRSGPLFRFHYLLNKSDEKVHRNSVGVISSQKITIKIIELAFVVQLNDLNLTIESVELNLNIIVWFCFALLYIEQKSSNWVQIWFIFLFFIILINFCIYLSCKKIFNPTTVINFIALYKTYVSWHGVCYCFVFRWNLLECRAYSYFIQTFISYHAFSLFTCYCTLFEKQVN